MPLYHLVSLTSGENSFDLWDGLRRGIGNWSLTGDAIRPGASVLHADGFEVGPFTNGPWLREELAHRRLMPRTAIGLPVRPPIRLSANGSEKGIP
ncbi:MAG: hypothetical protein U0361_07695 [Nitrospiraceae bacterium]